MTAQLLVCLFLLAAFTVWKDNPTIQDLRYVGLVVMLILMQAVNVTGRRAAAQGERSGGSEAAKRPTSGLRTVGIALVLVGLVLVAVGLLTHSWTTLGIGLPCAVTGIVLVRLSPDRAPLPATTKGEQAMPKAVRRFDRVMGIIGVTLVPLMAFSTLALFLDAAHGYHEAWPLYTFVAIGLFSGLVWSYLVARAYGKWLRR